MIALEKLKTESWDAQNFEYGRTGEPGCIYCLWPARDLSGRLKKVRINAEALSELSGICFMISSSHARAALLQCRDKIEAAANEKDTEPTEEISLEREDLLKAA
jgi:hypothetical protein